MTTAEREAAVEAMVIAAMRAAALTEKHFTDDQIRWLVAEATNQALPYWRSETAKLVCQMQAALKTLRALGWSPPRAAVGGEREAEIRARADRTDLAFGVLKKDIRDLLALLDAERAAVAQARREARAQALENIQAAIENERGLVSPGSGYDYKSGEEYGLRRAVTLIQLALAKEPQHEGG